MPPSAAILPSASPTPAPPTPSSTPASATSLAPAFGTPIGDVQCDLGGHDDAYHVHVRFRYTDGGLPADPDSNIGVDPARCMYWVHTHDGTGGVVHIEAPADVKVTLGDFLDVWEASFPSSQRLAAALSGLRAGKLTVNGTPGPSDWRSFVLADKLDLLVGE